MNLWIHINHSKIRNFKIQSKLYFKKLKLSENHPTQATEWYFYAKLINPIILTPVWTSFGAKPFLKM